MKKMTILVGVNKYDLTPVRLSVPDHFTEHDARNQYHQAQYDEWVKEPFKGFNPQPVSEICARFFKALKGLSNSNVIELETRSKVAERTGYTKGQAVHYLKMLRERGHVETRVFNSLAIKGYYLKY